jgi:hypothetical protein
LNGKRQTGDGAPHAIDFLALLEQNFRELDQCDSGRPEKQAGSRAGPCLQRRETT